MSPVRAACPAAAKPVAMPADDGVRLHDEPVRCICLGGPVTQNHASPTNRREEHQARPAGGMRGQCPFGPPRAVLRPRPRPTLCDGQPGKTVRVRGARYVSAVFASMTPGGFNDAHPLPSDVELRAYTIELP